MTSALFAGYQVKNMVSGIRRIAGLKNDSIDFDQSIGMPELDENSKGMGR